MTIHCSSDVKNFCENTCGWKSVQKFVKCCLKTENYCLKTQTKLKKCMHLPFFFFLSVFLWLYATLVGPVHCLRDPQTSFFSNFDVKNKSHGTIHIFKNYFTIVFSIFSKKSGIQTHPYCKLKRKIQIIICFSNISSIDFSKGLFLTPRYPNFCSSK